MMIASEKMLQEVGFITVNRSTILNYLNFRFATLPFLRLSVLGDQRDLKPLRHTDGVPGEVRALYGKKSECICRRT